MGWLNDYPRKYYAKYEKVEVTSHMDWYEVYRLPHDVYAIAEPQQLQEVNCFLVPGDKAALLIDTGMGILPIKPLVTELMDKCAGDRGVDTEDYELYTVNTHCHFDHNGSNASFQPVYVHDDEFVEAIARRGLTYEDADSELTEDCFQFGFPEGFVPEGYRVEPYDVIRVGDGHIFDLGNRHIRVRGTGGHCQDHICLYDEDNHILFTGDLAYKGALFANFDNPVFGTSDLKRYRDKMVELRDDLPEDCVCYVSHNDFVMDHHDFCVITEAFEQVYDREMKGDFPERKDVGQGFDFGEEGKEPHIYEFEGFSIYAGGED